MEPEWANYEGIRKYAGKACDWNHENAFKIILPNINAKYETENATVKTKSGTPVTVHTEKKLSDEEEKYWNMPENMVQLQEMMW